MTDHTDYQLLSDFAERNAEDAFEELVRRHLDFVFSAACRLAVDRHLAQDVTQGVFSALAQRASGVAWKLRHGAPLSAWLHLTTRNLAANAVRSTVRRRAREQEAAIMQDSSIHQEPGVWDEIAPHLDPALAELPEADRHALLLRFFERKTAREIGLVLGLGEEATQKRLARSLEALRKTFAARGVQVTSAALGAFLISNAVHASPVALAAVISKTAFASIPPNLLQSFTTLVMTKSQFVTIITLGLVLSIPLGVRQLRLNQLEARAALIERTASPTKLVINAASSSSPKSELAEMTRLLQRAAALRASLAARQDHASHAGVQGVPRARTLLAIGKPIPLVELTFAGNATPEAALQSSLVFQRDGDLDGLTRISLYPPKHVDEWNEVLASPEQRETYAEAIIENSQGAVHGSVSETHEDGTVSQYETLNWPDNPDGNNSIEILEKTVLDEHRTSLSLRSVIGNATRTNDVMFGLTPTGWKTFDAIY